MNAVRAKQSGGILNMSLGRKKRAELYKFLPVGYVMCSVDMSTISWLEQRIRGDNIGAISKSQITKSLILDS